MSARPLISPESKLYSRDFFAWTEETARLLRAGRWRELDVENVAEEIEDMGRTRRRELRSRLHTLTFHLLKWKYQAEKRSKSWRLTIHNQRRELDYVLEESPSLRPTVTQAVEMVYAGAAQGASIQTGRPRNTFPDRCPFTPEQILDPDYLPE